MDLVSFQLYMYNHQIKDKVTELCNEANLLFTSPWRQNMKNKSFKIKIKGVQLPSRSTPESMNWNRIEGAIEILWK